MISIHNYSFWSIDPSQYSRVKVPELLFCEGLTFTSKGEYRPYNKDRRQRMRAPEKETSLPPPHSPTITGGPAKNLATESEILISSYSVTWAWSERIKL